jgi:transposase
MCDDGFGGLVVGIRLKVGDDLSACELRRLARKEGDGKVVARMLAIASALDGLTREQAAKQAGMDRQILADWVHRYNEGGVEGLRDKPKGHPKRLLTSEQEAEIKARVLAGPDPETDGLARWRCVDIQAFIAETYKITLHKRTVAKLLTRMGLSHISVRPKHPKSDSAAQDTFKKTLQPQWQALSPNMRRVNPSKSGSRTKPASDKKGH